MSLGWKKFNFFERVEREDHDLPDAAACSCSSNEYLYVGSSTGRVSTHQHSIMTARTGHSRAAYWIARPIVPRASSAPDRLLVQVHVIGKDFEETCTLQAHQEAVRHLAYFEASISK